MTMAAEIKNRWVLHCYSFRSQCVFLNTVLLTWSGMGIPVWCCSFNCWKKMKFLKTTYLKIIETCYPDHLCWVKTRDLWTFFFFYSLFCLKASFHILCQLFAGWQVNRPWIQVNLRQCKCEDSRSNKRPPVALLDRIPSWEIKLLGIALSNILWSATCICEWWCRLGSAFVATFMYISKKIQRLKHGLQVWVLLASTL